MEKQWQLPERKEKDLRKHLLSLRGFDEQDLKHTEPKEILSDLFNLFPQIEKAVKIIKKAITSRRIAYDKNGEEHYNLISALHKSLRGSNVQAALYWLARMIEGGADPLYIVRRLVRFASEDIGLSNSR